ncbi:MAG: response regulator [Luteolibacter sp.]
MKNPIKVMMIEDHPEYREAVQHVLSKEDDFEVIGIFGNANQALRELEKNTPEELPNVILLDLNLPGMSGLEAMQWIEKYAPEAKIMVLSQSDNESEVFMAIRNGALGYLLKSSSMDDIKTAIRTVANGGALLDPALAKYVLDEMKSGSLAPQEVVKLTPREIEILSMIAEGHSQKDISAMLKLSVYTIAEHLTNIYEKLHVKNAPAAISKAFRAGILK